MPITIGLQIIRNAKGFCKSLFQSQSVRRKNHFASESIVCEDLALPSNTSVADHKATFSFKRVIDKRTRRPPHLVNGGEGAWKESRLAVGRGLDAELFHPVAKGVGMEIQNSRRTLWPINHSTCLLKGGQNMASLHFFHRGQS
jgi:hypothetical protein